MSKIFSAFCVLCGILAVVAGVYFSISMLWHGILQVIHEVRATNMNESALAWGVVKIIFCELPMIPAWLVALFCFKTGLDLLDC